MINNSYLCIFGVVFLVFFVQNGKHKLTFVRTKCKEIGHDKRILCLLRPNKRLSIEYVDCV